VFHQDRDRICFWIERNEKVLVAKLGHRSFTHMFVTTELAAGFFEIVRCDFHYGCGLFRKVSMNVVAPPKSRE
jgi:hypothetical protein